LANFLRKKNYFSHALVIEKSSFIFPKRKEKGSVFLPSWVSLLGNVFWLGKTSSVSERAKRAS